MAKSSRWRQTKHLLRGSLARAARVTGVTSLAMRRQNAKYSPYLRAVNYHWTPPEHAESLDRHLHYYAQEFECLTRTTLDGFFANGVTKSGRPALIVSFDDGFRNNFDVAADLLDRNGIKGWFFVITRGCRIQQSVLRGNLNTDYCMKWQDVRELRRRGHEIGCHTLSHSNVGTADLADLKAEILDSRAEAEAELGQSIDSFCFPFGTSDSFSNESVALVVKHYRFAFTSFPGPIRPTDSPFNVGRIPVEPEWSIDDVRFRLAGLLDHRYKRDRRRLMRCVSSSLGTRNVNEGSAE